MLFTYVEIACRQIRSASGVASDDINNTELITSMRSAANKVDRNKKDNSTSAVGNAAFDIEMAPMERTARGQTAHDGSVHGVNNVRTSPERTTVGGAVSDNDGSSKKSSSSASSELSLTKLRQMADVATEKEDASSKAANKAHE